MSGYYACKVHTLIDNMGEDEKRVLKLSLLYGKKIKDDVHAKVMMNSAEAFSIYEEELESNGIKLNSYWAIEQMNSSFKEGTGFVDFISGKDADYGEQLDYAINEFLIKGLKLSKPIFTKDKNSVEGAIQREQWITEKLMDSMISSMDEDAKKAFVENVKELLKEKGIEAATATEVCSALLVGGLTAARAIMGFNFHILVAQIANMIVRIIAGRGLSLAANAALQRFAASFFGPIGWIITGLLTFDLLVSLINPREYDKFIPAVFIIGCARNIQEEKLLPENI